MRGKVDKIRDVFDDCSVYVQPSTNEGFGITALEAMAHGRPVIISDGAGSSDCVVDSVNGFTVPAADSSAIATMIKWFKDHPDKVQELGDNARESSKQYSWDIIRSRYVEYFNQII